MNAKNLLALAITLGLSADAGAATFVWTGTVNGNWSNTANWNPNGVPTATDRAEFSPGATWRTVATPGSGYAIDDLYFPPGADAYSLDTSGGALNLGLGVLSESGGATRNEIRGLLALTQNGPPNRRFRAQDGGTLDMSQARVDIPATGAPSSIAFMAEGGASLILPELAIGSGGTMLSIHSSAVSPGQFFCMSGLASGSHILSYQVRDSAKVTLGSGCSVTGFAVWWLDAATSLVLDGGDGHKQDIVASAGSLLWVRGRPEPTTTIRYLQMNTGSRFRFEVDAAGHATTLQTSYPSTRASAAGTAGTPSPSPDGGSQSIDGAILELDDQHPVPAWEYTLIKHGSGSYAVMGNFAGLPDGSYFRAGNGYLYDIRYHNYGDTRITTRNAGHVPFTLTRTQPAGSLQTAPEGTLVEYQLQLSNELVVLPTVFGFDFSAQSGLANLAWGCVSDAPCTPANGLGGHVQTTNTNPATTTITLSGTLHRNVEAVRIDGTFQVLGVNYPLHLEDPIDPNLLFKDGFD